MSEPKVISAEEARTLLEGATKGPMVAAVEKLARLEARLDERDAREKRKMEPL